MKICIVTDQSREDYIPSEEAILEDLQKNTTVDNLKDILQEKYDCISMIADENIISNLKKEKVDLVFNLCNGLDGNEKIAQIPAILEFSGIPYTGSSILGQALAINKIFASTIFHHSNLDIPRFHSIYNLDDLKNISFSYPILIKPNDEGSSRGIHQDSLVFDLESLEKKLAEQLDTYTPPIMLNEYIQGREFSVGVLGNGEDLKVIAIQEVDFSKLPANLLKFNSFEVKSYYKSHTIYHIPARLDPNETDLIEKAALKAFNSLMLKDYGRVDIILKDGIAYVLEINSLPGLQKGKSALYRMAEGTNLGYENLVYEIVEAARKRYNI